MSSTDNWNAKDWEEWEAFGRMEHPYWRDGMTPEQFDTEGEYYCTNYFNLVEVGKYTLLWKQKEAFKDN